MKCEPKQVNPSSNYNSHISLMLIHSEIQCLCFGRGELVVCSLRFMLSSKCVYMHIKANNLHHADYSLVDLMVINCFLIHDTTFVKKKIYIKIISQQHSVIFLSNGEKLHEFQFAQ